MARDDSDLELEGLFPSRVLERRPLSGGHEADVLLVRTTDGEWVVKVSPAWRTSGEINWALDVAAHAATSVAAAIRGVGVGRVRDRVAVIYPFVEGTPLAAGDRAAALDAARVLGAVHAALLTWRGGPRPAHASDAPLFKRVDPEGTELLAAYDPPELRDESLDAWWNDLAAHPWVMTPTQGDFWSANILCRASRVVALVDWDDARVIPCASELAVGLLLLPEDPAAFIEAYRQAGGPVTSEEVGYLEQLLRLRIRDGARRDLAMGVPPDHPWMLSRYHLFKEPLG